MLFLNFYFLRYSQKYTTYPIETEIRKERQTEGIAKAKGVQFGRKLNCRKGKTINCDRRVSMV